MFISVLSGSTVLMVMGLDLSICINKFNVIYTFLLVYGIDKLVV